MSSPCFSATIVGVPKISSIATLGDEPAGLTCSVDVARRWAVRRPGTIAIHGYTSFEEAADAVRHSTDDALLVPSAYPRINTFFFDDALAVVEVFITRLPDFVLAIAGDRALSEVEVVYLHPATESLYTRANLSPIPYVMTSSNSKSARLAQESDRPAAAITNSMCANGYGLNTVEVLTQGTRMSFNFFQIKQAGE